MSYADKLPTPEQFDRDWQDTIRCDLRNESPGRFGELEFPERPIVLEDEDFILTPIAEPFVDRTFVWSADGSPVHVATVLSAAAYYAAAPDRERFATVRKIGRAVRFVVVGMLYTLAHVADRTASRLELAR